MKFKNAMLIVKDIDVSCKFYKDVFGLRVVCDFGVIDTPTIKVVGFLFQR